MYILKNSAKNLLRNKGRNLILIVILLAMLSATAVSMIINTTTDGIIKDYKDRFGSKVYIQTDMEKFKEMSKGQQGMVSVPEIPDKVYMALADSDCLKETLYKAQFPAYAPSLKGLDQDKEPSGTSGNIEYKPNGESNFYDANTQVIGFSDPNQMEEFKDGTRKISDGKLFANEGECIVSEDFAKLNGLKVGDVIEVRSTIKEDTFEPLKLKVTGVYFDISENKFGDFVTAATNPRNEILTAYNTLRSYQDNVAKDSVLFGIHPTYYLKNPELLEQFNREAHEKGLDDLFKLATDEVSYNQIVKPVEGLSKVSGVFLTVVLIFGAVILTLLSILSIRERKYEIGVLRAMGMRKSRVVRGLLYESLITIALCLVLGLGIGSLCAQPVADNMLQSQAAAQKDDHAGFMLTGKEPKPAEIDVSLTASAVTKVAGIAVVLGLLSSAAGVLAILRYEPMKILSERNG